MESIQTKYLPWTNTKPSRIKASAEGVKSIIYTTNSLWKDGGSGSDPTNGHAEAAKRFAKANDWPTNLVSGGLPDGTWAHCFLSKEAPVKSATRRIEITKEAAHLLIGNDEESWRDFKQGESYEQSEYFAHGVRIFVVHNYPANVTQYYLEDINA